MTAQPIDRDAHEQVPLLLRRLINLAGRPFGINPFPRVFHYALGDNAQQAFTKIYQNNDWGSAESASGVGSELAATARYRQGLINLIRSYNFGSMFDAPCGDLHWMLQVLKTTHITYSGGDISSALVEQVKSKHPNLSISRFDIRSDDFPNADLWHCRDCLFHLPFADIKAALRNFANSQIPYALLTTHRARFLHRNLDVRGTGFRFLDLERAPLFLPRPITYIPDYRLGREFPRYVGLWSREMILTTIS